MCILWNVNLLCKSVDFYHNDLIVLLFYILCLEMISFNFEGQHLYFLALENNKLSLMCYVSSFIKSTAKMFSLVSKEFVTFENAEISILDIVSNEKTNTILYFSS